MGVTTKLKNKAIRQENLRDQLSAQGHIQHVIDIVGKLSDPNQVVEQDMVQRYKITIDTKLRLINKYLPDLKSTEITGPDGGELTIQLVNYADTE